MCKQLLEITGKELGYQVHIACQNQKGLEYVLTKEEINEANVAIDLERLLEKNIYLWYKTSS